MGSPPPPHDRHTPRCSSWNYRTSAVYYLTLSTHRRTKILSRVTDGTVHLTELGALVDRLWQELPTHVPGAELGRSVVMPNHFHGIVRLPPAGLSLTVVVGQFKAAVSREAHRTLADAPLHLWQRSFHDRVVRSPEEWARFDRYIAENPARWRE